jgi:hypothetical protein
VITHTAPKKAVNGVATFQVGWTAPSTPGGVNVQVYALAANGDGTPRGDGGGMGFEAFAFGCSSGMMLYRDYDGDGYGSPTSGYTRSCVVPTGYALKQDDCDDNDERVHPGAMEICNHRDDNCNTLIDEGLPVMTYSLAPGGGAPQGAPPTVMDCAPPQGYCALASCGTGWCRRLASSCASTDCTPGQPRPETCNGFDDDCDGVIDNGTELQLCGPTGLQCVNGMCVKPGTVVQDAGAVDASDVSGSGGAGGSTRTLDAGSARTLGAGEAIGVGGQGSARQLETPGCDVAAQAAPAPLPIVLASLGGLVLLLRPRRRRARSVRR